MSAALSIIALVISALALAISFLTAWLTLLRRGTVKMTQPTQIFFGYDKSRDDDERPWPKVFLRTLLFSTAKRGVVIENLYVKIACEEIAQTFSIGFTAIVMSLYGEVDFSSAKPELKRIITF